MLNKIKQNKIIKNILITELGYLFLFLLFFFDQLFKVAVVLWPCLDTASAKCKNHSWSTKRGYGPPRPPGPPWSTLIHILGKIFKSVDQSGSEWTMTPLGGPGAFRTTLDHALTFPWCCLGYFSLCSFRYPHFRLIITICIKMEFSLKTLSHKLSRHSVQFKIWNPNYFWLRILACDIRILVATTIQATAEDRV